MVALLLSILESLLTLCPKADGLLKFSTSQSPVCRAGTLDIFQSDCLVWIQIPLIVLIIVHMFSSGRKNNYIAFFFFFPSIKLYNVILDMDQAVLYFANAICCGNKNTTNEDFK